MKQKTCHNCGHPIPDDANYCPNCSAPVSTDYEMAEKPRGNRNLIIALVAVACAALIGIIGYLWHANQRAQQEANQWAMVEKSHDADQIQSFINEFPDGKFITQAQDRLALVKQEIADWNRVNGHEDIQLLQQFMDKYPDGPYHDKADSTIKVLQLNIYNRLHSEATLKAIMNEIENCYNHRGRNEMIATYGSQRLKDTFARYGNPPGYEMCYLLMVDYSDGDMSILGRSVTGIADNSCQMNFKTLYNGPDITEDYGTATFSMVLEDNQWLIDDIEEDGYDASYRQDPKAYIHIAP